jgi:hypothetical protein
VGYAAVAVMGLLLGMLGGGGGILTVPILVGFFGLTATHATGSSLLVVGTTSLVGAIKGIFDGLVNVRIAVSVAIPSMLGGMFSRAVLIKQIPDEVGALHRDEVLLLAFACLMVIVGIRFLSKPPTGKSTEIRPLTWHMPLFGLFTGLISGLLGAGGGFLILPLLTLYVGLEMKPAVATSLLVISIQSLGAFLPELAKPVPWMVLGPVVAISVSGMLLGLLLRDRAPRQALQLGFTVLVFSVAIWLFARVGWGHFHPAPALH